MKKLRQSELINVDPHSSGSDTENEDNEFMMGQKIFFTEGGRTNKVKIFLI